MASSAPRKVLISGASITGPTLGFWLHKYGFDVTIIERSDSIRMGGYPIDVRGTAIDVIERMGLLPALQKEHIQSRLITFIGATDKIIGEVDYETLAGAEGRDVELPRGRMSSLLYDATRDNINYVFGESIKALKDDGDGVDIEFESGKKDRYDFVLAGDGLHSNTRRLILGPEKQFSKYLGYCFGICTIPNTYGFSKEAKVRTSVGQSAMVYAIGDQDILHILFVYKRPEPTREELSNAELQRQSIKQAFGNQSWMLPELLKAMENSDDLYFDAMQQIHMPKWSSGRVALCGDAAYGPSFFSGQGTSTSIVGAYVLASELAAHSDYAEAFKAYEATAREFIEANQATASDGADIFGPETAFKLWMRNNMIRLAPLLARLGLVSRSSRKIHSSLKLPDYDMAALRP
ncbi:FAD-dependent monooxygenase [Kordiimonas pumila]|uniref:FAD-dependent monooxygenase n=1 Tax=Kordiimonas pumila TaxID=2161677 RepID=A0ABV7D7J1_9PROT|nr:FAD-dependent monooxygenase [Kordiimonas pumila]